VGIFTVGSALQTAAQDYAMLVVARLIGGVGIGMFGLLFLFVLFGTDFV
jgi:predicted MFS family arabinose efflux permease